MACTITDVQINGQGIDSNGVPTSYELAFRVGECAAVDIEVFDTAGGQRIFHAENRLVSGTPDAMTGLTLIVLTFVPSSAERKACNATYRVVVTCSNNKQCKWDDTATIHCKTGSPPPPVSCAPTTVVTVRDAAGAEVNLSQPCLDHGTYTIEVVSPWSSTATAQWSVTTMPGSGGSTQTQAISNVSGRQLSYVLPDALQPPDTMRAIGVIVHSTLPDGSACSSLGTTFLPPVHPTKCPTAIALELRRNGGVIQPASSDGASATFANLPAGFYELRVTDPVGSTYNWFTGGATAAQSGAQNTFNVDLSAANSPRQIDVFVETGECCPVLRGTAVLTMAAEVPPEETTPPTQDPPEVPPPPPVFPSWCGPVRALLALALVVLFTAILFIICPSPLTAVALPIAVAAAAAAIILLALELALCGLSFYGFWRVVIWALRWAIILGGLLAIVLLIAAGPLALPIVVCVLLADLGYGIVCGWLILWVTGRGCTIPPALSLP